MGLMTESLKAQAAKAALEYIRDGMTLGLGTGSTAKIFIDLLGEKVAEGWEIQGIPTSEASHQQAVALGIPLIEPDETTQIDVAVDGADEIDPQGHLIKGGGAALLREKIIAQNAARFVVIADGSKDVQTLGQFPLPIEVEQFGWALTVRAMRELLSDFGFEEIELSLRSHPERGFVLTDGGNYVVDAHLGRIEKPRALDEAMTMIPGVFTTGLFVGLEPTILIGKDSGVERRNP